MRPESFTSIITCLNISTTGTKHIRTHLRIKEIQISLRDVKEKDLASQITMTKNIHNNNNIHAQEMLTVLKIY